MNTRRRFTLSPCRLVTLSLAALFTTLPACNSSPNESGKPVAVATIFAYYDALRAIAGNDVETAILLPPGTSPHDYHATVEDKKTINRAKLLIRNGIELDDWASSLAKSNKTVSHVVIGNSIKTIETKEEALPGQPKDPHAGHDHDHDHAHADGNPHVWLDPTNQIKAAEMIRDALIKLDPAHKNDFETRATAYINDLKKLDEEFKTATATFKHKEFIGFHSAYDYLARRYGLTQAAALQEAGAHNITVEGAQKVIQIIRDKKIPVLFTETAFNAGQAKSVIDATGIKTGILQPLETYDAKEDTYLSLMRKNLEELKRTMQ
jgi:zinc/manganese transport system substrate-binding protein